MEEISRQLHENDCSSVLHDPMLICPWKPQIAGRKKGPWEREGAGEEAGIAMSLPCESDMRLSQLELPALS
jgi:hypothetical protein